MTLQIKKIAIHEVVKKQTETTATEYISNALMDVKNKKVISIIELLDNEFTKKTGKKAKFLKNDGFVKEIKDFSNIDLLNNSGNLTTKLKDQIMNITNAVGGYLVFCEYANRHDFLSVFLVRNTNSNKLSKSNGAWDVETVEHLDLKGFAMGVKINLTLLLDSNSDDRYLTFVKGNTKVSEYFEKWVGIDDFKTETKDFNSFMQIVENIDLPQQYIDENKTSNEFKSDIYNYIKSKKDNRVNLKELSNHFYDDDSIFDKYALDNNIDIDGEFKVSSSQLKKLYRINVQAEEITLQAPFTKFSKKIIKFDNDKIIIDSKDLHDKVKAEVEKQEND